MSDEFQATDDGAIGSTTDVEIIIVGTGFSGLGLGTKLARAGKRSFLLLERADDVGGTWRDNDYPGAACDVSSHLYSLSFRPNPDWTHVYSPQAEIHEYLRETAREEGLMPHIRFGCEVVGAEWDEVANLWRVSTSQGSFTSRVLVTAAGHLSDPKYPNIPGLDSFEGHLFHSAGWNHDVALESQRIGVIGTGASSIQIIPEVAEMASHLTVFQRSAPYVRPRPNRQYTPAEKRMFRRVPESLQELRAEMFWNNEARLVERQALPALLEAAAAVAHKHREAQVIDPEIREKLKPNFVYGCKRGLRSDDYYPTFNRENVTLECAGIDRVEGKRVIMTSGDVHELDVIIASTGFETTDLPISYIIKGRQGRSLADAWSGGMQAYATLAVSGFPNLFIMGGPNTGLGHNSAIYVIESQIDHILGALQFMAQRPDAVLEVSAEAENSYVEGVESRGEGTVWLSEGCQTWYVDPRNGRLTSLWPDFAHSFRRENAAFVPDPYLSGSTTG